MNLYGMRVVESPLVPQIPVLSLKAGICSEVFEEEMNAWLLERFGKRDQVLIVGDTVFVSPRSAALLRGLSR